MDNNNRNPGDLTVLPISAEIGRVQSPIEIERERMHLKMTYTKFWAQIICCMALLGASGYQVIKTGDLKWIGGVTTALGTLTRSPADDLEKSQPDTSL